MTKYTFFAAGRSPLRGIAYLLWIISLLPVMLELRNDLSGGLERIQEREAAQLIEKS